MFVQNTLRKLSPSPCTPGLPVVPDDDVVVHKDSDHEEQHCHDPHEIAKDPGAGLYPSTVTLLKTTTK